MAELPIRTSAEFAQLIKDWREAHNLSQREAATVFSTQQSAISDWEDPNKGMVLQTAIMLAETYGYQWVLVPSSIPDDAEWLDTTAPCEVCGRTGHIQDPQSPTVQDKTSQGVM